MVTGKRAFEGKSPASLISAIMSSEPAPMTAVQPMASPALDRVVRACLAKDPDERWQSARDVKHALECIQAPAPVAIRPRKRRELAGYALALCLAAALAIVYFRHENPPASGARMLLTVSLPEKAAFRGGSATAISPDGSRLAASVITPSAGHSGLWVRPLDAPAWQMLPGTEGGSRPAWSPDGRSLVFSRPQVLEKMDLVGSSRQTLCSGYTIYSPNWGSSGVILFARAAGPLYQVAASGGPCVPATTLDAAQGEVHHLSPNFLPDGRHFVYMGQGGSGTGVIWAGSLDSKERVRLVSGTGGASYAGPPRGPGYLLYEKEGIPMAHPFDPVRLRFLGEPVPIPGLQKVSAYRAAGVPPIAASQNGVLIQRDPTEITELIWFDRSGKRLSTLDRGDAYTHVSLSPDDARVVYTGPDEATSGVNLWVADVSRDNAKTRLNHWETAATIPIWSSDGAQVAYSSTRGGGWKICRKAGNGTGQEEVLVESKNWMIPSCWSADGRYLVYHEDDPATGSDIWLLQLGGERKPRLYLRTQFDERTGQISPDGRWMAYTSNESGQLEVYVSTFPEPNRGKWPVSVGGGAQAMWRRDGKELFYVSPEMKVLSVQVKTGPGAFEASRPQLLFTRPRAGLSYTNRGVDYAVTADGKRFLANTALDEAGSSAMTVLTNWTLGLRK